MRTKRPGRRGDRGGPASIELASGGRTFDTGIYGAPPAHPAGAGDLRFHGRQRAAAEEEVPEQFIALVRVSSKEQQQGVSPQAQTDRANLHCERLGIPKPVPREDVEDLRRAPSLLFSAVESATERSTPKRFEFKAALELARPGVKYWVREFDRFARSALVGLSALRHLERAGATVISERENIDTSTPDGKLMFTFYMAIAEREATKIAGRTSAGRQWLRRRGNYTEGGVPLGYERSDRLPATSQQEPAGAGPLMIIPREALIVVEAFQLRDKGEACWRIAKIFNEKYPGVRRWGNFLISKMLRSRVYIGQIRAEARDGEWIDAHPAIVSRELFFRVQKRLDDARSQRGRPADPEAYDGWFLHGLMECGLCGSSIRSAPYETIKLKPNATRRTQHRGWFMCYRRHTSDGESGTGPPCKAPWPFLRENEVHDRAAKEMNDRLELLRDLWGDPKVTSARSEPTKDFAGERKKLKSKIQRIADGYADRTLTGNDARRLREETQKELAKLDAEEKQHEAEREAVDPATAQRSLLKSLPALRSAWEKARPADRRDLFELLTEKIELFPTGNLTITWRDPTQVIKKLGFISDGGELNVLTTDSRVDMQFVEQPDGLEIIRKSVASSLAAK